MPRTTSCVCMHMSRSYLPRTIASCSANSGICASYSSWMDRTQPVVDVVRVVRNLVGQVDQLGFEAGLPTLEKSAAHAARLEQFQMPGPLR